MKPFQISVLSDGSGQYKILNLRPGTYTVTFSLTGFASIKRDGIELTGSFVATVNADLRLGSLEETVTVSGESPIVDIQSTTHERVLGREAIEAIPTSNTHFSVASSTARLVIHGARRWISSGPSVTT